VQAALLSFYLAFARTDESGDRVAMNSPLIQEQMEMNELIVYNLCSFLVQSSPSLLFNLLLLDIERGWYLVMSLVVLLTIRVRVGSILKGLWFVLFQPSPTPPHGAGFHLGSGGTWCRKISPTFSKINRCILDPTLEQPLS